MTAVKLLNGELKKFDTCYVTGEQVALSISKSLAKEAIAVEVDGVLQDLSAVIPEGALVQIVTAKDKRGLEVMRHDAAHALAQAVKRLYPDALLGIGPVIEDGFYYDFACARPFSESDLAKIEQVMSAIIKEDLRIAKEVWTLDQVVSHFSSVGEGYKVEIAEGIDLAGGQELTVYRQGEFVDLCKGPHAPSTGRIAAFKLLKVSGAYWKGDAKNAVMQRIYGTAWESPSRLQLYLKMLEEAKERDHRKLGRQLGLFHLQDEARGSIFWHAKGYTVYRLLQQYIRNKLEAHGYQEVKTPIIIDRDLWERSGHWDKFRENMFIVNQEEEKQVLAIKPMSCPGHVQIFNQEIRSYKDLPIKIAEFGCCHRNEPSGSLHGILRTREFVQDDAHIFCSEAQLKEEVVAFCNLLLQVYSELGFVDVSIKFSDRPVVRAGSEEVWDKAEAALKDAIESLGLDCESNRGEGAFYGPKLEFALKDCLGREWQCGTLQVDLVLPERLGAHYIGRDGEKHRPVMLHRAILGTFERFMGILIEHYKGAFPLWLAPVQVVVVNITDESADYAVGLDDMLKKSKVRSILDLRNEQLSFKIREHSAQKVPFIFVVGNQERLSGQVSVKQFGQQQNCVLSREESLKLVLSNTEVPCQ